jgi:hypothetical protein
VPEIDHTPRLSKSERLFVAVDTSRLHRRSTVLCDTGPVSGAFRLPSLLLALACGWLAFHQLLHAFFALDLLPAGGLDSPYGAVPVSLAAATVGLLAAMAWANRTRLLWHAGSQSLVVEKRGLASIARWRVAAAEIAAMRVKRRRRRLRDFWDIGFTDFAGNPTQIVRAYSEERALAIASRAAEAMDRPLAIK